MSPKRMVLRWSNGGRWKGEGRKGGHLFLCMASPSLCELFFLIFNPLFIHADQNVSTNRFTSAIAINPCINSFSDVTSINNITH